MSRRIVALVPMRHESQRVAGKNAGFITGSALNVDGGIGICLHDPGLLCKETV